MTSQHHETTAPHATDSTAPAAHAPRTTRSVRDAVLSRMAWVLLAAIYGTIAILCFVLPRRRAPRRTGSICVVGTFHNPNWYRAHILPLTRSGVRQVLLVVDSPQAAIPGVRFACPPRWLARALTRAAAKFIWMIYVGLRYRPDLYMGYHILPGAGSALVAGRLLGRPAIYQMTGGPIEIDGGGAASESWVTGRLGQPSPLLERLALRVARAFDAIIVRGPNAAAYLAQRGITDTVRIITGSVNVEAARHAADTPRRFDLVYVGRLAPFKQPDQFIRIVAALREHVPTASAAVLGDGPMAAELRALSESLRVAHAITWLGQRDNPATILQNARLFVLTSRSEGLSIALAEAMAAGVVPVVADVGELAQLVSDGKSGYLVTPNDIDAFATRAAELLLDQERWRQFSRAAVDAAATCSTDAVAQRWRVCFDHLLGPAETTPRCVAAADASGK